MVLSQAQLSGCRMLGQVVVHVDMDCFYAQVEMLRLGVRPDEPFVVTQWGSLIAVNYPARAFNISRFGTTFQQALELCPSLKHAHVPTIAPGETSPRYYMDHQVKRASHKVSLEPYRDASKAIFSFLIRFFNTISPHAAVTIEKGGVDEAFLDLTKLLQQPPSQLVPYTCVSLCDPDCQEPTTFDCSGPGLRFSPSTELWKPDPTAAATYEYFCRASVIVEAMRAAMRLELGYRSSAGVSSNRMLAKALSASFKPNRQAVLVPSAVDAFMLQLPLRKLRGFGGKLGQGLEERFNAKTCGDLKAIPMDVLAQYFHGDHETADHVFRRVRGEDVDEVVQRTAPKSMIAQKNFQPSANTVEPVMAWVQVLAVELGNRVAAVQEGYHLVPTKVNIKLGTNGLSTTDHLVNRTLNIAVPFDASEVVSALKPVVKSAVDQLNRAPSGQRPAAGDDADDDSKTAIASVRGGVGMRSSSSGDRNHRGINIVTLTAVGLSREASASTSGPAATRQLTILSSFQRCSGPTVKAEPIDDDDDVEVIEPPSRKKRPRSPTIVLSGEAPSAPPRRPDAIVID